MKVGELYQPAGSHSPKSTDFFEAPLGLIYNTINASIVATISLRVKAGKYKGAYAEAL